MRERISTSQFKFSNSSGFTLIELLVVLMILSILIVSAVLLFNPVAQIQKSKNATREHDLQQIKTALDTYFNDHSCYPTTLTFGSKWSSGSTVYMQKVPEDPDCSSSNTANCYDYETDNSPCPQWNILYARLQQPIVTGMASCVLNSMTDCLPSGGMLSYNYCTVSGKVDCDYVSQHTIPQPVSSGSGSGGSGSTTPTPIPTSICNGPLSACTNGGCDVENSSQCIGCGGAFQCYTDLKCGGNTCK